jgi:hypothetical protein
MTEDGWGGRKKKMKFRNDSESLSLSTGNFVCGVREYKHGENSSILIVRRVRKI